MAIWDTGATSTVVTRKVVDECGLIAVSRTKIAGVDGKLRPSVVYLVDIYLPNRVIIGEVPVAEAPLTEGTDVLIGMDIITLGDFAVSSFQGKTTFTFRIPSMEKIDFVISLASSPATPGIRKVGRNAKCPCGSGRKYKNCHGA